MKKFELAIVLLLSLAFGSEYFITAYDYGYGYGYGYYDYYYDSPPKKPEIDINNPKECPQDKCKSEDDYNKCCENLNKKRRDFPDCCLYPQLVVWTWQFNACVKKIQAQGKQPDRCTLLPCCFEYMGVIDKNVLTTGIKPRGLMSSFLMSRDNDTRWVAPINTSVTQCHGWFNKPTPSKKNIAQYKAFWDCYETVPLHLQEIISCSYDFNYLNCPEGVFNKTLDRCDFTMKYLWNCLIGGS